MIKRLELLPLTTNTRASLTPSSSQQLIKLKILNSCIRMWPSSSSNTINSSINYDRENAIAVGHIAHAVQMLAMILAVPLRYPVVCRSSKSYIIEQVGGVSGLTGIPNDREPRMLALYRQTSAPEDLFFYAVNLLNFDLVQIRLLLDSTSHRTIDHSDPLVNLKWIFDFFNK